MLSRGPSSLLPPAELILIGGSAGAIAVLGQLLPCAPTHLPVVVVLHQHPRGPNLLVEVFRPLSAARVAFVEDKAPVGPGVWVAPRDYHVLFEADRCFALSADEPINFSRPSLDVTFESAAEVYGPALLAIVLTGASADGAAGARAVRLAGGKVAVQDPSTAEAATLPETAVRLADPQIIANVAELGALLRGFGAASPS